MIKLKHFGWGARPSDEDSCNLTEVPITPIFLKEEKPKKK